MLCAASHESIAAGTPGCLGSVLRGAMIDRRQDERSRARTFAWCDGPEGTFYCAVHDASESGIFLHMGPDLPRGTPLQVTMDAILGGPVVVICEVVWRREGSPIMAPGVGLRFVRFLRGEEAWHRFLRQRRRSPSSAGTTAAQPPSEGE